MLPHLIHIVRRFGQVGGMENYVWHLVHGIASGGYPVSVICEEVFGVIGPNIDICKVPKALEKPRWKSMLTFRSHVACIIHDKFKGQKVLIHSHERSICHHITTFHGPPISYPRNFKWLAPLNRRLQAWRRMEFDELFGPNVQMVLVVSTRVYEELSISYPSISDGVVDCVWPGVDGDMPQFPAIRRPNLAEPRFVFVGKEWKRKGLDIALRVVERFRKIFGSASLTIFGPNYEDVPKAMARHDWAVFKGWSKSIPWADFDVLLHPARKEPFGMVVAEARRHGVGVLMSEAVGASDLRFSKVISLDVDAPLTEWIGALEKLLADEVVVPEIKWSWDHVVRKHVNEVYPKLKGGVV